MSEPSFGIHYREDGSINDYVFVEHAFRTIPVFKGEDAKLALDLEFDAFFGFHREEHRPMRPLLSIAMGPLEEFGRNGPLYHAIETFAKSSISEFFPALSIQEYLNMPREIQTYVLTISENLKAEKLRDQETAMRKAGLSPQGGMPKLPELGKR